MMTLLALSLSIGLLIDDAIVVRENIVRHTELGKDHVTAALDGTKEIASSTCNHTSPLWRYFYQLPLWELNWAFLLSIWVTVSTAVLISMFISFTLDPMLSAHWKDPVKKKKVDCNVSFTIFLIY